MLVRSRRLRGLPRLLGLALPVLAVAVLAGCGGKARDSGGMTSSDRGAAQTALDQLRSTAIPTTLVEISNTAGAVPRVCQVHVHGDGTYDLFVFWRPIDPQQAYAWLQGNVTKTWTKDRFHVGYAAADSTPGVGSINGDGPSSRERRLQQRAQGDAFTKPFAACELLSDGTVRLLPTGKTGSS